MPSDGRSQEHLAPQVSILVCSIDPEKFARVSFNYRELFCERNLEIIGIHDARSLAEGYNRGVAEAHGDILILSHDDIAVLTPDFAQRIVHHLSEFDLIGVAGTTKLVAGKWIEAGDPYVFTLMSFPDPDSGGYGTLLLGGGPVAVPAIRALDGVFMAMRRDVAEAIAFDAELFDDFHLYDLDFSFRAFLAGFKLAVCRDIVLIHDSDGNFGATWAEHKRRFESKHSAHLPPTWKPKFGAHASFTSASKDEILQRCNPARISAIAAQIERANASL